jgi:hypothetical protein
MGDGLLGKCKECTKYDMRENRQTNPRVREYDRARAKLPHRVTLRTRVTKEWRRRHPMAAKAQAKHNRLVRDGRIGRAPKCEACGLIKPLNAHHPDYSKPLLVVWLCKPCHAIADKVRRKVEAF